MRFHHEKDCLWLSTGPPVDELEKWGPCGHDFVDRWPWWRSISARVSHAAMPGAGVKVHPNAPDLDLGVTHVRIYSRVRIGGRTI
jgi:hypothetical protein